LTTLQSDPSFLRDFDVPALQVGAERVGFLLTFRTGVGVHCWVAYRTKVVVGVWIHETVGMELQISILEPPETVNQHTENMGRNSFLYWFEGDWKKSSIGAELTLDGSPLENRLFSMIASLAESILDRGIAVFVKPYMTVRTIRERIVLFEIRAETSSAGRFEHRFRIFSCLFVLLSFHVLFKLLFIIDSPCLRLSSMLLDWI
jgi:hypothetical protein